VDFDMSQRRIERCCASGVLERRHAGVFVNPAATRTPLQDLAIAVAIGGPLAAAWGRSAAALWGLINHHPPTPEIVVPWRRHVVIEGAIVHRSRALSSRVLMHRDHIRVTDPLIATIDLGVVLSPVEVAEVIIRARQMKLFEPSAVRTTLDRIAKPGRTGTVTSRAALELIMIGDRPAETVLELRFHIGPGQCGLPRYAYQHEVRINGKRHYIDFAYPEVMLAIEVDGYEKRASRDSLDYDNERANRLVLAGWSILRFTWTQVTNDPRQVAADILSRLGQLGYRFGR
jgi:hypothetical protein